MKIRVDLGDVQRTLFMPVWARAVETRKSKPMLNDETSVKIIDDVDFDFSHMFQNVPEISQIAWIARCKRFDLVVSDFIKRHPKGTLINIGCGLDTSYERIKDHSIRWYDLDLPDVIELKTKFLSETSNRKYIPYSFSDTKWFDQIIIQDNVLFQQVFLSILKNQ